MFYVYTYSSANTCPVAGYLAVHVQRTIHKHILRRCQKYDTRDSRKSSFVFFPFCFISSSFDGGNARKITMIKRNASWGAWVARGYNMERWKWVWQLVTFWVHLSWFHISVIATFLFSFAAPLLLHSHSRSSCRARSLNCHGLPRFIHSAWQSVSVSHSRPPWASLFGPASMWIFYEMQVTATPSISSSSTTVAVEDANRSSANLRIKRKRLWPDLNPTHKCCCRARCESGCHIVVQCQLWLHPIAHEFNSKGITQRMARTLQTTSNNHKHLLVLKMIALASHAAAAHSRRTHSPATFSPSASEWVTFRGAFTSRFILNVLCDAKVGLNCNWMLFTPTKVRTLSVECT